MTTVADIRAAVVELIPEMYADGWTIAKLHRQWGLSTSYITEIVRKAGVYEPGRKMGAPLKDLCIRGHDMSKTRKFDKQGKGYCEECKRIRERVT